MDQHQLESICNTYLAARASDKLDEFDAVAEGLTQRICCGLPATDVVWSWLASAVRDEQRKWFVVFFVEVVGSVGEMLFEPMIRAAVYEINPSFNRSFVEPCIKSFGYRRVIEWLIKCVEHGTDFEKAGAVNALYWANVPVVIEGPVDEMAESRKQYEEFADLWTRKRSLYLTEFVRNESVDVRRSIIPSLNLDPDAYPEQLRPLVPEAIRIARQHPDGYIRHRVEVQLGNSSVLPAKPHRQPPAT